LDYKGKCRYHFATNVRYNIFGESTICPTSKRSQVSIQVAEATKLQSPDVYDREKSIKINL
jgi:hypothetical protein